MPATVHLAIGQFRPRKGDYAASLARLGHLFSRLETLEPRPQVLHLPETALTGYFLEGGVRDQALTAGTLVRDLDATYREAVQAPRPLDVIVGFYEIWRNRLHNSVLYVTLGAGDPVVRHVHRKVFLPTYGMFDEERFVEQGHDVRAFDTPWGRAAMLVCEDAWHSLSGTLAALDGAQVVFVSSAAPARGAWPKPDDVPGPASLSRWERLIRDIAEEHGVYVSLAQLMGSEGGKVFAGGSLLAGPKGEVRARGPLWEEALVTTMLDFADLTHARTDMPLVADLETMLPHMLESLDRIRERIPPVVEYDQAMDQGAGAKGEGIGDGDGRRGTRDARRTVKKERGSGGSEEAFRVVHTPPGEQCTAPPLAIDGPLLEEWLVHFLREEMERRGFEKAVVGISGGVDSAVTAFLAARALEPRNVLGLRLPYRSSSKESLDHAQLVIDQLGIESRTIDISPAVDGYLAAEPDADAGRRGNVMARMRMIAIFDQAARLRALPLGTGNKTERLFGYFTWHADDSPPVNPIGDLFKTQVWALARHLGVPGPIVAKPATADLIVGQTDEADFGITYEKADRILNTMLAGYSDAELIARGFDETEVALVRQRLEGTHWKRRLPTVALVSPTAIGESYLRPVDY
ncbi:MAG TPA: NAD+ synthase [Gemmatimonadaceae bacterium]|nr:NAD+ synthase [Gemmatimonadaceae bacterium]